MLNNICKVCGSDNVELITKSKIFKYTGKTIKIHNCKIVYCKKCKNGVYDKEDWNRIQKILEKFRNDVDEGRI